MATRGVRRSILIPIEKMGRRMVRRGEAPEALTFREMGLGEDALEDFIRANLDAVLPDESLLVVGQQTRDANNKRSDLIAVDEDGGLVLIEIKRDAADAKARSEPFESQALRYVAALATIRSVDDLILRIYVPYLERWRDEFPEIGALQPRELAYRKLVDEFLKPNKALDTFNARQRIVLAASDFDAETLSASAWLAANGIPIRCVRVNPVRAGEGLFLQPEELVPGTVLSDFYVPFPEPGEHEAAPSAATRTRTTLPRMAQLMEWGILAADDRLTIKGRDRVESEATVINDQTVNFQGQHMSFNAWGQKVTGWTNINIYEWAVKEGVTLADKREAVMRIQEMNGFGGDGGKGRRSKS